MKAKILAYWRSRAANIHGLILFFGGAAGMSALTLIHLPSTLAQFISGGCMILGALLYTPSES